LRLFVNPRSALPIYQQIVDQLKSAVAGGLLLPGQQLPSVRDMAGELAINPNTVARAYSILEQEGFILRKQGSGTFVAEEAVDVKNFDILRELLERIMIEAYHLQLAPGTLRQLFEEALDKWNLQGGD
jgi:GntR family transcriptional regulator